MRKWLLSIGTVLAFVLMLFAGGLVIELVDTPVDPLPATEPSSTAASTQTTAETTTAPETQITTAATTEAATQAATQPTTLPPETTSSTQNDETTGTTAPAAPHGLLSKRAFVYDLGTDSLLFHWGDMLERVYPASLTKLFTAFVALQHLDPDALLTAGDELDLLDPNSSLAFIYRGQTVTVRMCVQGMLMKSGNDAAYILAVGAGRAIAGNPALPYTEALKVFMDEVNRMTRVVGLHNTHFTTPDGIHAEDHYTTMTDLIIICRLSLENEIIRQYCGMVGEYVTYASGETSQWYNTNSLLHPESEYYMPQACGLKTGSTEAAGNCLLSSFRQGDSYLLIGTLGAPEYYDRYVDTKTLYYEYAS